MKIELKKFKFYERMSEETNAFSADVYINDVKAATASNEGHGGPTNYHAWPGQLKLVTEAENHFKSLPKQTTQFENRTFDIQPTLEGKIDELVEELLMEQEKAKRKKYYKDHIVFGTDRYYKRLKLPYMIMVLSVTSTKLGEQGPAFLIAQLQRVKKDMESGERILNDNIPAEILHQVFPPEVVSNE